LVAINHAVTLKGLIEQIWVDDAESIGIKVVCRSFCGVGGRMLQQAL
jgi:hypothetical protein